MGDRFPTRGTGRSSGRPKGAPHFTPPVGKFGLLRAVRTTVNNGYLGSRNDEERSEMRYVMRIAEFSESSNL